LARLVRDCEVKKEVGLSNALLTFLPVARRFLRGGQQFSGALQRQQVLSHTGGEGNSGHGGVPFWLRFASTAVPSQYRQVSGPIALIGCPTYAVTGLRSRKSERIPVHIPRSIQGSAPAAIWATRRRFDPNRRVKSIAAGLARPIAVSLAVVFRSFLSLKPRFKQIWSSGPRGTTPRPTPCAAASLADR